MVSTISSVFRRRSLRTRKETPYLSCPSGDEEQEEEAHTLLECQETTKPPSGVATKFLLCEDTDGILQSDRHGTAREAGECTLTDCFYLGSYDMTGRVVKGQGCIDEPAAHIWQQTQLSRSNSSKSSSNISLRKPPRRRASLPNKLREYCPKYVRLVACSEQLRIVDNHTEEVLVAFKYQCISFTGTHPKYGCLFCFVAWESKQRTPYCHVFKCENSDSASSTAHELSKVFQRKCRELIGAISRWHRDSGCHTVWVSITLTLTNSPSRLTQGKNRMLLLLITHVYIIRLI